MVGCRALVPVVGQKTVPLVGKPGGILGNIDKMPVVRFVAIWSNLIRPVCDGCEARIADQGANPDFRVLGQAGLG
jgi:tRNA(Ile2) C34 agmatinyltransferase TiaS